MRWWLPAIALAIILAFILAWRRQRRRSRERGWARYRAWFRGYQIHHLAGELFRNWRPTPRLVHLRADDEADGRDT